jgi:hypothetical protein
VFRVAPSCLVHEITVNKFPLALNLAKPFAKFFSVRAVAPTIFVRSILPIHGGTECKVLTTRAVGLPRLLRSWSWQFLPPIAAAVSDRARHLSAELPQPQLSTSSSSRTLVTPEPVLRHLTMGGWLWLFRQRVFQEFQQDRIGLELGRAFQVPSTFDRVPQVHLRETHQLVTEGLGGPELHQRLPVLQCI